MGLERNIKEEWIGVLEMDMKALRLRTGLNTTKLAAKLNRTEGSVRAWEFGRAVPAFDPRELDNVLEVYGCTMEELCAAIEETEKQAIAAGRRKKARAA